MKLARCAVSYGKGTIGYSFCHADRKTLEIAVHPNQSVHVKAPLGTEPDDIHKRVANKARWIIRQQNYFRQFIPRTPARSYVGGETHLYLGKRYRLKIRTGLHDEVKLIKGFFMIQVKGRLSSERVKCLLDQWYEKKAAEKFTEFFEQNWALLKFSLDKPKLQIKRLKKRWGSTSRKGLLTLNVDLICAPKECIEYVIVHELCHLQCKNHNTQFYKLLGKIMPDWERRKLKLETAMS